MLEGKKRVLTIASVGLGLNFGILIVIAMYLTGILAKIKERRMMKKCTKDAVINHKVVYERMPKFQFSPEEPV